MKHDQKLDATALPVIGLDAGEAVSPGYYGRRAAMLARLQALGLPVPDGFALSFETVNNLAQGGSLPPLPELHAGKPLIVRNSPGQRSWGGSPGGKFLGVNPFEPDALIDLMGEAPALEVCLRLVSGYSKEVFGFDPVGPDAGADPATLRDDVAAALAEFETSIGQSFPPDLHSQIEGLARAKATMWYSVSTRVLREAKGAPADAGLGLIVQEMPLGQGETVTGEVQFVDSGDGRPGVFGVARPLMDRKTGREPDQSGNDLENVSAEALEQLRHAADVIGRDTGDAMRVSFVLNGDDVSIVDAVPVRRNARADVRISVDLARAGRISREHAILRIDPLSLGEHLHQQIAPDFQRDLFGTGFAASPGAATGRIVFRAEDAQSAAARDEATILVRSETGPEDIRGMHSAQGVLTIHGGNSSHAAVIARGIGLPCVVGASGLRISFEDRTLTAPGGRVLREGDWITIDGTSGEVLVGSANMIPPEIGGPLHDLLNWADEVRALEVRANADTPADARTAREFRADGIGLCRTEHMFFEDDRIGVMRRMILAEDDNRRQDLLDRLLPMQREDFVQMLEIMRGLPVTIRLLDPPLHEFMPTGPDDVAEFAAAVNMPVERLKARLRELSEVNPMLGMRGVRLGVVMPSIYEMQARAIFEALIEVNRTPGKRAVPEIMLPLVTANREAELIRARIDAVAQAVQRESGMSFEYGVGIMVETPRAALRAGDLAETSTFLSFGTNDLTQMTYGLSRDDAGRFMREYVSLGVFREDPFRTLDIEGVGELLLTAARRGRERNPAIVLGLCGEHGGDPSSIRFCQVAGFDYVSCSPYRVPVARLAAAQAALLSRDAGRSHESPDA